MRTSRDVTRRLPRRNAVKFNDINQPLVVLVKSAQAIFGFCLFNFLLLLLPPPIFIASIICLFPSCLVSFKHSACNGFLIIGHRTTFFGRNNNSSRFGKYNRVFFDESGTLVDASVSWKRMECELKMLFYHPMIWMTFLGHDTFTHLQSIRIYQYLSHVRIWKQIIKATDFPSRPFGQFGQCDCESSTFKVTTYLLESSRVVVHAKRERTYHCFYVSCHRIWTLQDRGAQENIPPRVVHICSLWSWWNCEVSGVPEFIHERLRRCCEVCQMKSCLSCICNGTSSICCLEASPLILRWTGEMVGAWKNSTGRWQLFGSGKLLGAKCITWEDEICYEHRHVGACWSFVSSPVNWLCRTCSYWLSREFSGMIPLNH